MALSIHANNVARLLELVDNLSEADCDEGGLRVFLSSLIFSCDYEAVMSLKRFRDKYPEVKDFIENRLDQVAKDRIAKLSNSKMLSFLNNYRNATFHYLELLPGKQQKKDDKYLKDAIADAREVNTCFTDSKSPFHRRFNYADEVKVRWLPDISDKQKYDELSKISTMLIDVCSEVIREFMARKIR